MKITFPTILFFLISTLFSCQEKKMERNEKENATVLRDTVKEGLLENPAFDLTNTKVVENVSRLPDWLKEKHITFRKDLHPQQESSIEQFNKLSDSLYSCVFVINDGVCLEQSIVTYLNRNEVSNLDIAKGCDHEQSLPNYEWKEYKMLNPKLIEITNFKEFVNDSIVSSDGQIMDVRKDGFETMLDSVITLYKIEADGKITGANNAYN